MCVRLFVKKKKDILPIKRKSRRYRNGLINMEYLPLFVMYKYRFINTNILYKIIQLLI
jgi:hypothetical protein